jgi:hypothetical protein
MAVILTLGPVTFSDFEVPDEITGVGGDQSLVVHKLVGGNRIVDAMGRDDTDIKWSGRFRGQQAETRARLLDALRVQGQPIELTWASYRYQVCIKTFEARYTNPLEIPYSIIVLVIADDSYPLLPVAGGLDAVLGTDLNTLLQIANNTNIPAVTNAVLQIQNAMSPIPTFQGASATTVLGVQVALAAASGVVNSNIASNNTLVAASGSVGGVVGGGNPTTMATGLLTQEQSFTTLGQLYMLRPILTRMATNITNAGN